MSIEASHSESFWREVSQVITENFSVDAPNSNTRAEIDLRLLFEEYVKNQSLFSLGKQEAVLSASSLIGIDLISDISSFTRNILGVCDTGAALGHLLGESAFLSFVSGYVLYCQGVQQTETALLCDKQENWKGFVLQCRGLSQLIGSLGLAATRSIALLDVFHIQAGNLSSYVSLLGIPSIAFSGLSCACVSLYAMIGLYDICHLYRELGWCHTKSLSEVIEILRKEPSLEEMERTEKWSEQCLEQEVDRTVHAFVLQALSVIQKEAVAVDIEHIISILSEGTPKTTHSAKKALGLLIVHDRKQQKRRDMLENIFGKELLTRIDTEYPTKELVDQIYAALFKALMTQTCVTLLGMIAGMGALFGGMSLFQGYVVAGYPVMFLSSACSAIVALVSFALDGPAWIQALQQETDYSWRDLLVVGGEGVLGTLCVIGLLVIAGSSMTTAPVLFSLAGSLSWLSVSAIHMYMMQHKENQFLCVNDEEIEKAYEALIPRLHMSMLSPQVCMEKKRALAILRQRLKKASCPLRCSVQYVNCHAFQELQTMLQDLKEKEKITKEVLEQALLWRAERSI